MDRRNKDTFDISSSENKNEGNKERIHAEFEKLSKSGNISEADLVELSRKFPDKENIIDEYLSYRSKRYATVKKQARKLAKKIAKKYSSGKKTYHEIIEKMMRYKNEYKWSDLEFDEFRKELNNLMLGNNTAQIEYGQELIPYKSRIAQTLGYKQVRDESGLKIKDSEQTVLAEILKNFQKTLNFHNRVFLSSLTYDDCSLVAMSGEFKRDKYSASNYIHPLFACMFLPKFDIFEVHMLYSNIGRIIKQRYEKKPIVTEPDSLVFYDMSFDPNDVVCDISSPITDLRNRFQVQIHLWETVQKLREGNYYEVNPISELISALNLCRNNLYDNADLIYNQDEGAILRKLLSVFSLRPTFIATKPIYSIATLGDCGVNLALQGHVGGFNQFVNQPVYTITSVPMINLQIPPYLTDDSEPIDLKSAANQTVWINENKTIVPKEQSIIYSKEVLIFYINRRIQRVNIKTFSNPLTFSQLPLTSMNSFDRVNKYPVTVPDTISIRGSTDEQFQLRSVVAVTETSIVQGGNETHLITGSTGLIASPRNPTKGIFEPSYYLYDPLGASIPVRHPQYGEKPDNDKCGDEYSNYGFITNKPISFINGYVSSIHGGGLSFYERASTNGTIFFYAKRGGYTTNEIVYV